MLFHASIPADEPERVARVVAELWQGRAMPFPPHPGAFIAWSGDERGTVLDVFPRGREHAPAPGEYTLRTNETPSAYSEVHLAIGTALPAEEVFAIAAREGWLAQHSDRAGLFKVIEFWIENKFLLELLTTAEQKRYAANVTPQRFRELFGVTT